MILEQEILKRRAEHDKAFPTILNYGTCLEGQSIKLEKTVVMVTRDELQHPPTPIPATTHTKEKNPQEKRKTKLRIFSSL